MVSELNMVSGIYILNKETSIPLYSVPITKDGFNPNNGDLVSGLMGAIVKFSEHIQIGQITNFDTQEHKIIVASSASNILSLVYDQKRQSIRDPHYLAAYLLDEFERKYPELRDSEPPVDFDTTGFDKIISDALSLNMLPFFYNVVKWAKKEYGGEPLLHQQAYTENEEPVVIDIMLDRGNRDIKGILDRVASRVIGEDFSKDIIYIKVVDGQAGAGEIREFLNMCSAFGRRRGHDSIPSYFPSIAVVVARSYSPTVPRIFAELQNNGDAHYLIPEAAPRIAKSINKPPKSHQCLIQCWQWDKQYPDLVYE